MKLLTTALFLASILLIGCVYEYDQTVSEKTKITNLTARPLSLSICKLPYKELSNQICPKWPDVGVKDIEINQSQSGSYLLSHFTATVMRGTGKDNPQVIIGSQIFLTGQSFNDVTLCRDNADPMQIFLVELNEACPADTTAQAAPIDNCQEALPIDETP